MEKQMKVRMADVARYLGISKATVSLAVNNKPGVNEETREKILHCIEEIEKNNGFMPADMNQNVKKNIKQQIKVVFINHKKQIICDPEMDLWSGVVETFDSEIRKRGYIYSLSYLNEDEKEKEEIIEECNMPVVSGVIVFGTEMMERDRELVERINKPLVIYDYEFPEEKYCSVCIDNVNTVKCAMERLKQSGAQNILYISTGKEIYNFTKRREGFINTMEQWTGKPCKERILTMGKNISEIQKNMYDWIEKNELPEAFLFENYQISIGVLLALRKKKISIPEQIKVIGIDEVPEYMLSGNSLTYMKIPHRERAAACVSVLENRITIYDDIRGTLFLNSELVENGSV